MGQNDQDQKKQLALQNSLQQQQLDKQNAIGTQLQTSLAPYLSSAGQGFAPGELSALYGSALDQNASRYNAATQQTNANLSARGENGLTPLSGVAATGYGNLQASKAGDLADALRTVTLNDAQQNTANRFNANSQLAGLGQTYAGNVGTFGSGASGALSNLTTAQQGGFFNNLSRGLGAGLGSGLSAGLTGGLGELTSSWGTPKAGSTGGSYSSNYGNPYGEGGTSW